MASSQPNSPAGLTISGTGAMMPLLRITPARPSTRVLRVARGDQAQHARPIPNPQEPARDLDPIQLLKRIEYGTFPRTA
jgi:hypothetical protein